MHQNQLTFRVPLLPRIKANMDRFVVSRKRKHREENGETEGGGKLEESQSQKLARKMETCANSKTDANSSHGNDRQVASAADAGKESVPKQLLKWRNIARENLDLNYCLLYTRKEANELLVECEKELEYFTGDLARVRMMGKWIDLKRKQVKHRILHVHVTLTVLQNSNRIV